MPFINRSKLHSTIESESRNEPKYITSGGSIHPACKRLRPAWDTDSRPGGYSTYCRSSCLHYGRRDTGVCANGNTPPTHRDGQPDSTAFEHASAAAYFRDPRIASHYRRAHLCNSAGTSHTSTAHVQLGRRQHARCLQPGAHFLAGTHCKFQHCQPDPTTRDDRSIHVRGDRPGSVRLSHHGGQLLRTDRELFCRGIYHRQAKL